MILKGTLALPFRARLPRVCYHRGSPSYACAFEEAILPFKYLSLLLLQALAAILRTSGCLCAFEEARNSKCVLSSLKVCAFTSQSVCFRVAWQPGNPHPACLFGGLKDENYKEKYLDNKELASRALLFYGT